MPIRLLAIFTLVCLVAGARPIAAQSPHELVAPSVVHVAITYTSQREGPTFGTDVTAQGTGFFVSPDGSILTSYHLVEGLVADNGNDVRIDITLGGAPGQQGTEKVEGALVDYSQVYDLLLLKIRPGAQAPPIPVRMGRAQSIGNEDRLFTSGFNGTEPFNLGGSLASRLGPARVGYLWSLQMGVAAGQSGSPVYLGDGTVVGVLKGSSNTADGIGYMVPIDYADNVVPWLRIAELERTVQALQVLLGEIESGRPSIVARVDKLEAGMRDIGGFYQWSGELVSGRLLVTYNKLLAGDPHVQSVKFQIFPIVDFESGRSARDSRMDSGHVSPAPTSDGKSGEFAVDGVAQLIAKKVEVTDEAVAIPEIEVRLVATTTDGVELPPKVILVDARTLQ